ncbi:MAG: hypothetical protein H7X92_10135 [Chitinophagales bacterium]|nr:hypothetical protein [Hyphomicrobiales bacterium]
MANPNFAEAKSLRKCQTWFLMQENEAIGVLKKHIYEKLGAFNTFDLINSGTHFGHGDDFEIFGWDFVFKISGQAIGAKNQTLRYFNSQVTPCGDVTEIEIPESEISKYE